MKKCCLFIYFYKKTVQIKFNQNTPEGTKRCSMKNRITQLFDDHAIFMIVILALFSWFFWLMLRIVLQYVSFETDAAFLQIKQTEVQQVSGYLPIFYIHVWSAGFSLLAGFTQFSSYVLKNYKKTHRLIGYIYFLSIVFLAAPSGIFIGFYANGGFYSRIAFIILGCLWFIFTVTAIQHIIKRRIIKHKMFMYLSFALTLSAITLRMWKVIIVYLFMLPPMDVYRIISWLGWVPNLLFAIYLVSKMNKSKTS